MAIGLIKFGAELVFDAVSYAVKSAIGFPVSRRRTAAKKIKQMVGGLDFSFSFDDSEVQRMITDIERNVIPKATVRALNKVAQQARTAVIREIALTTGMKQKGIRKDVGLSRANRNNFKAVIHGRGKPVPLINFSARQLKKGVSAKSGPQRKTYKSAFITKMPGGHKGVFIRKSKRRLPIREMYGPSVSSAFISQNSMNAMRRVVESKFDEIFEREFNFMMSRYK